jgi:hypothetical protein
VAHHTIDKVSGRTKMHAESDLNRGEKMLNLLERFAKVQHDINLSIDVASELTI